MANKLLDALRESFGERTAQSTQAAPSSHSGTSATKFDVTNSNARQQFDNIKTNNPLIDTVAQNRRKAQDRLESARQALGYATDPWMEADARKDFNKAQSAYDKWDKLATQKDETGKRITEAAKNLFNSTAQNTKNVFSNLTNLANIKNQENQTLQTTQGNYGRGNIDLNNRPKVQNSDGSYSTVDSTSFNIDGKEVLIPTVINMDGRWLHVDPQTALRHYEQTGEYLGKFDTPEEANAYAEQLHKDQEEQYSSQPVTEQRTPDAARFAMQRGKDTAETMSQMQGALDKVGKRNMPYSEGNIYNGTERSVDVVKGAAKQYGSGMVNLYGTTAQGLSELGDTLGGNTNPYAGWATDEMTASAVGHEHDPNYYAAEQKYNETVQATADKMSESAAEDLARAKNGLGKLGQAGVDIATNVIQMGFDAALGALTGGGSLAAMFLRSAGSGAQEARQAGATTGQQLAYGGVSGGIEVLTEKLADGLAGIYGAGAADDVAEEVIRRLAKSDVGRTMLRGAYGMISEGGEEVISDLLNPFARTIYNNRTLYESYAENLDPAEMLYDFLIGAAIGGIGSVGNVAKGGNAAANAELRATDEIQNDLVNSGMDAKYAPEAANILSKLGKGETITQEEAEYLEQARRNSDMEQFTPEGNEETRTPPRANPTVEGTPEQVNAVEEMNDRGERTQPQPTVEPPTPARANPFVDGTPSQVDAVEEMNRRGAEAQPVPEPPKAEPPRANPFVDGNRSQVDAVEALNDRAEKAQPLTPEQQQRIAELNAERNMARDMGNTEEVERLEAEIASIENQTPQQQNTVTEEVQTPAEETAAPEAAQESERTVEDIQAEIDPIQKQVDDLDAAIAEMTADANRMAAETGELEKAKTIKQQLNEIVDAITKEKAPLQERIDALKAQQKDIISRARKAAEEERFKTRETVGASKPLNPQPETHIDNRTDEDISKRNVNAFQYDNPEVKPFFKRAAEVLRRDLAFMQSSMRSASGKGTVFGAKSPFLERVQGYFGSLNKAIEACEQIIYDKGRENFADPKRIELFLDEMLTNGYTPVDSNLPSITSSAEYMQTKGQLEGGTQYDPRARAIQAELDSDFDGVLTEEDAAKTVDRNFAETGFYDPYTQDGRGETINEEGRMSFEELDEEDTASLNDKYGQFSPTTTAEENNEPSGGINTPPTTTEVESQSTTLSPERTETKSEGQAPETPQNPQPQPSQPAQNGDASEYTQNEQATNQSDSSSYEELGEQYGTIPEGENAAREANTPQRTTEDSRVSESVRTVMEAEATPNSRIPTIQDAVTQGRTSFVPVTNQKLADNATNKIREKGFQTTLKDWTAAVRSGKASAELVAEGAVLLNNAGNSAECSGTDYIDLMLDYVKLNRTMGRGLAAARILKTLTPEGRLYAFQKTVQQMSEAAQERRSESRQQKQESNERKKQMREARRKAKFKASNDVFTFEYSDEAAQAIARSVEAKAKPRENRSKTMMEQLVQSLTRLATERIPSKSNSTKVTATDILAEIAGNEEFAREAYEMAQQYTRDENYNAKPGTEGFTDNPINFADSKIVQRAIAETALDTNENKETIRRQAALGMSESQIANYLASNLAERVNASDDIRGEIAKAAQRYVGEILGTDTKTSGERVATLVKQMMSRYGERFNNLAKSDDYSRENARQAIVDALTMEYGVDAQSAANIADAIADEFEARLQEAIAEELENRFGDKVEEETVREVADELAEAINLGAFDSQYEASAINKLFGVEGTYTLDPKLIEEYRNQTDDAGRDAVIEKMEQAIADQIPSTMMDKFNALRYLNMLGNLKTQSRNILGNIGMMTVQKVKNTIRSGMESVAQAATGGKYQKQYSTFYSQDLKRAARNYFDTHSDVQSAAMGESKYSNASAQFSKEIDDKRTIFKFNNPLLNNTVGKGLESYRKATNWLMNDFGDKIFVTQNFTDGLAGYLQAHNITADRFTSLVTEAEADGTSTAAKTVDEAVQFAIKQAQEATFRDTNAISKAFSEFDRNWSKAGKTITQGIIPFRKTPANVFVRMEEYSPLGFANALSKAVQSAKGSETVTSADVIDSLSKSLTGTGLAILGFVLAAAGRARTKSDDDKQEALDKLRGLQDYSVTLGGKNFTLDWATPTSAALFMGVEGYNLTRDGNISMEDAFKVLGNITSPMLEMSMLSGLNDSLNNLANFNDDTDALPQFLLNSMWSYLTQGFTSTLLGQAEQASEQYRQTYYTDPDNPFLTTSMQKNLAKAGNKTPGVDFQAADYIDAWGRKVEAPSNPLVRGFNAFINPAYTSTIDEDEAAVYEELQRLYDYGKTQDDFPNVLPETVKRSQTVNGTRLSPEEYETYATEKGQKSLELVNDLINSSEYKKMSDDEKAAVIADMYAYAKHLASKEVARSRGEAYEPQNAKRYDRMDSAEDIGIDPATYYGYYQKSKELDNNKSLTAQQKAERFATYVINQKGLSDRQKNFLRDSFNFTTTLVADTEKYDMYMKAGLTPEEAQDFNKKINTDGNTGLSNAERFAAIEQYAKDADMAEKLWQASGSSTSKKKSYAQANPSTKFKGGSTGTNNASSGNILIDMINGGSRGSATRSSGTGTSNPFGTGGATNRRTSGNILIDMINGQ